MFRQGAGQAIRCYLFWFCGGELFCERQMTAPFKLCQGTIELLFTESSLQLNNSQPLLRVHDLDDGTPELRIDDFCAFGLQGKTGHFNDIMHCRTDCSRQDGCKGVNSPCEIVNGHPLRQLQE